MTMDEFVDATLDVWDIPSESATRVGHPAPFPVELPRRLIELYTYRGDLVLDPFMGSGSTAVAAVRTERHYVGFDTDPVYVELAERRIASERAVPEGTPGAGPARRVTVPAGRVRTTDADGTAVETAVRQGRKARELALQALVTAGFTDIEENVAFGDLGVSVEFRARDASGGAWLFDLSGALSATRPGLRRPEVLWRALGKASVIHEARRHDGHRADLGPLVLLTTDLPAPGAAGAKSLRAVVGGDGSAPVHDVVELLDPQGAARLSGYAGSGTPRQ
jgi:site-specific DNA-methyltransferase (adenine-specific)